ncbi:MAG: enoyl-CoA hydratase/isomerase family protein [Mycobacterium sp.]
MTDTALSPALVKHRAGVAVWLRLQRAAAMNAISTDLLDELNLALNEIESDQSVRVVVLTGTGRAFCAGADLKALANAGGEVDPSQVVEFVAYAGRTIERLAALAQPVIAGVNGLALAGGLELLLASDIVVASSAARIGDAHANYGLIPGAGGSVRLTRVVGTHMAKYLAFTGAHFPASSPVLAGLVSEIVDPEQLESRLAELAATLADKSPLGLRRMKRLINDAPDQSLRDALAAEQQALREQCSSADFAEGIAAFAARRTPIYQGR